MSNICDSLLTFPRSLMFEKMSSFLSRIRSRALSQSTIKSDSVHSICTIEPVTPTLSPLPSALVSPTSNDTVSIVDRKILADTTGPFSLRSMDDTGLPTPMHGLSLPPRPKRSTLTKINNDEFEDTPGLRSPQLSLMTQSSQIFSWSGDVVAPNYIQSPRQDVSPSSKSELEQSYGSSLQSTFGRYSDQLTPPPSQSKSKYRPTRISQQSERSSSPHASLVYRSSQSLRSSESPSNLSSNKTDTHSKPSCHAFSSQEIDHPTKTPSHSSHSEPSSRVDSVFATPVSHVFAPESPRTFGHPSPSPMQVRSRDRHRSSASPSPPPPLPPLKHPELVQSLASRSRKNAHLRQDENNPPQVGPWHVHLYAKTLPTRLRRKTESDIRKAGTTSKKNTFGRPLNNFTSITSAQRIFKENTETLQQRSASSEPSKTRPRSKSDPVTRRPSAHWCAQQAIAGVTSNDPGLYGWPAEVSREILKLSLGEDVLVKLGDAGPRSDELSANTVQRGGNVPTGLIRDSLSRGGPPCLQSSLIPSSPPLRVTLQSPILLQGMCL